MTQETQETQKLYTVTAPNIDTNTGAELAARFNAGKMKRHEDMTVDEWVNTPEKNIINGNPDPAPPYAGGDTGRKPMRDYYTDRKGRVTTRVTRPTREVRFSWGASWRKRLFLFFPALVTVFSLMIIYTLA